MANQPNDEYITTSEKSNVYSQELSRKPTDFGEVAPVSLADRYGIIWRYRPALTAGRDETRSDFSVKSVTRFGSTPPESYVYEE